MAQEYPIPRQDQRSDGVAMVEWGDQAETGRPGGRGDLLTRLARDARLVPVVGGLGAVAAFASLVGEWTVTRVPGAGADGLPAGRVPAGIAEVGNFGTAHLVGVSGVVCCLALVLFGSPGSRRNARVLGLAISGALLAVLVAATLTMDDTARLGLYATDPNLRIEYGRGLVTAYVATGLLGLALLLAGRVGVPVPVEDRPAAGATDGPEPAGVEPESPFSWRRQGTGDPDDDLDEGPRDLTVGPTAPFASPEPPDPR
ncbi:hypothetical protein ACI2K4_19305 [Micromonospora sp. NPDC050397]|uniref:hypothetical protein n=1 Tax=Micromonospora sp. NPDC050397 TaxID=3364279 RepID=UPI0038505400